MTIWMVSFVTAHEIINIMSTVKSSVKTFLNIGFFYSDV